MKRSRSIDNKVIAPAITFTSTKNKLKNNEPVNNNTQNESSEPTTKKSKGNEYVYLIREREFIRLEEETFKLGKTTQEPNSRLRGYPNESEVIMYIEVENCDVVEKKLISEFDDRYIWMKKYGREYYQGDKREMQHTFLRVACEVNETEIARKKSWFWWALDSIVGRKT